MLTVSRAFSLLVAWSLAAAACSETAKDTSGTNGPVTGLDGAVPSPAGPDATAPMTPLAPMQADATVTMVPAANDGGMNTGIRDAAPMPPAITLDGGGSADGGAGDAAPMATADAGTFPPVPIGMLTSGGSFTVVTKTGVGPGSGFNVYHPRELGQNGLKHPVLTWGNGAATTPDFYPLLPALAKHGFVVIAAQTSFVDGATLKSGLDWMLMQNTASGEFQGKLDPTKVAAFGYSLGSLATYDIGTDPRLVTTVHVSGGLMGSDRSKATAIKVPSAYFCDKDETGPNCDGDFAAMHTFPRFYGRVPGNGHVDYVLDSAFYDRMNAAVIGWMRWKVMGDQAMAMMFSGASCTLCQDRAWEIMKKNME
jgi:hypothetical protein